MHTEFEIKFLHCNPDEMREKLCAIGAHCTFPLRRMYRYVFAHPTNKNAFIRIRQEGEKITTTYKQHDNNQSVDSVQEIEVVISDAEAMRSIYLACGLHEKAYQETERENREYEDEDGAVDISIDRWPGLDPFIEIEGPTQDAVARVAKRLGYEITDGIGGTVSDVYHQELGIPLEIINNHTPTITFSQPPQRYIG